MKMTWVSFNMDGNASQRACLLGQRGANHAVLRHVGAVEAVHAVDSDDASLHALDRGCVHDGVQTAAFAACADTTDEPPTSECKGEDGRLKQNNDKIQQRWMQNLVDVAEIVLGGT